MKSLDSQVIWAAKWIQHLTALPGNVTTTVKRSSQESVKTRSHTETIDQRRKMGCAEREATIDYSLRGSIPDAINRLPNNPELMDTTCAGSFSGLPEAN
ncbi:hypothetical protein CDAR_291801 [Caerostris darwini]|uniref:Uncharacterized protein n=1 Tax=Caerostris darwini TaxID=1538125 RepID=A0AAV4NVM3_9ARAC|nr:hypothetical protein CDAR_291801 [Caerostris darwini]